MQLFDGCARLGPNGVGHRKTRDHGRGVANQIDRALTASCCPVGHRDDLRWWLEFQVAEQIRASTSDQQTVDRGLDAPTRDIRKIGGLVPRNTAFFGRGDNRARDGMFRIPFQRGSNRQRFFRRHASDRSDVHDAMLSQCQGAGLVEHDRGQVAGFLEPTTIAHQQSVLRAHGCRNRDHQRHGQPERMWTGDHQHSDEAFDRLRSGGADE